MSEEDISGYWRGQSIEEFASEFIDDVIADLSFYAKVDIPARFRRTFEKMFAKRLRKRLKALDNEYVRTLEEENAELRTQIEDLKDRSYQKLQTDLRWMENLTKHMLYYYEDGEEKSFDVEQIKAKEPVILDFARNEDKLTVHVEESE
jgi:hypothetical protein